MTDFTNMIIKNKWNYLSIQGINHDRLVGIDKKSGEAYDFFYMNYENYRAPETEEEVAACMEVAREYYDTCIERVRIGEFAVVRFVDEHPYFVEKFFDDCVFEAI